MVDADDEDSKCQERPQVPEWEDDPANPYNWSNVKKAYNFLAPAAIAFVISLGVSTYTPASTDIRDRFGVSPTLAILPFTLYVLGLAFGPMLAAPISETVGRRPVYFLTLPISIPFMAGAGFAQNFHTLLICRFFAGFFGSPTMAVSAGTAQDLYPMHVKPTQPDYRATVCAVFVLFPFLGSALGPVLGGITVREKGWRWTQWEAAGLTGAAILFATFMSETYARALVAKRAKKHNLATAPKLPPAQALKLLVTVVLLRPIMMLIREPIVSLLTLYTGVINGIVYSFFAAFPLIFTRTYDFDVAQAGLPFLSLAVGATFGAVTVILCDKTMFQPKRRRSTTYLTPEDRLYAALIGTFGPPIGLFWFAWTARDDIHWIVPILAAIPIVWGNVCVFTCVILYFSDTYDALTAASALAGNGMVRYTMGGVFPLFTVQLYERLGTDKATSMWAGVMVVLLPIPWLFWIWGGRVRGWSRYVGSGI
ncbi:putative bicyclomycin resistance protein [Patellaria atrata CBS 101060]|uniref:Bicyclomycin resistance protein n=1 Tax=Patellaria atrata CBS 101060 TaxID=1346257 RepID=A0A9P4SG03_9PEZI|nr:putative bicyclomycin resistance protein [Patellaria atrata CBS 101060]